MNIKRMKAAEAIADRLMALQDEIETLLDEEQAYFDNMPDSLQIIALKMRNISQILSRVFGKSKRNGVKGFFKRLNSPH